MAERIWVLGAADPEMEVIESLLRDCGETVVYAMDERGERVSAVTAYRATALSAPLPAGAVVYRVECAGPPVIPADAVVIDHHRPGDPGYGLPPAEFLPASSIGQVVAELARLCVLLAADEWLPLSALSWRERLEHAPGETLDPGEILHRATGWYVGVPMQGEGYDADDVPVPQRIVCAAAADHCLAAAYRGECPGVDPDEIAQAREGRR